MNLQDYIREGLKVCDAYRQEEGSCRCHPAEIAGLIYETSRGSYITELRESIENAYLTAPTRCGKSFGEILCYEIHENGLTFKWLAQKWNISLPILGELIWDHCKRLGQQPNVEKEE